jgi:hydroxymethylpyrimidine/phosphomethylpyrimidine kinase
MQTALTIAGFDPSSGAGVTADLMVFAAHGLQGTACITALTVQSPQSVWSTHPTSPAVIRDTLACLDADCRPAGIKIGMLGTADNTSVICEYLEQYDVIHVKCGAQPVVLDPVLRSTSGRELLDPAGVDMMRERLLPLVDWITPNLDELAVLSGEPVTCRDDLPRVSRALQVQVAERKAGKRLGIFATGGHLDPPDDFLLTPEGEGFWLSGERIDTPATHGTGCALSSAFLSRLVLGDTPYEAALAAKRYVAGALRTTLTDGSMRQYMNHLRRKSYVGDEK